MIVGVDTSILVPAVHANHPLHSRTAAWLNRTFERDDVMVCHHSLLEAYSVLTRLPPDLRLTRVEAENVLRKTYEGNTRIASFNGGAMWTILTKLSEMPVVGGACYDAFTIIVLLEAGVTSIATYNTTEFGRITTSVPIVEPN